jgi:hypothetical protein
MPDNPGHGGLIHGGGVFLDVFYVFFRIGHAHFLFIHQDLERWKVALSAARVRSLTKSTGSSPELQNGVNRSSSHGTDPAGEGNACRFLALCSLKSGRFRPRR